jgi:hypothetical protein
VTDQLKDRFRSLAEPRDDSSWQDVRRRARGRSLRRPVVLVAAGALLAVLATAPALGLHRHVVDFLETEPAPSEIRMRFEELDIGAPKGMESGVLANETRRLRLPSGETISVAPTRAGGFCTDGGCIRSPEELKQAVERMGERPGDRKAYLVPVGLRGGPNGIEMLEGNVLDVDGRSLVVEFVDGTKDEVPFVWVSEPINAGFWRYRIPAGTQPTAVVLRDGKGDELARDQIRDLGSSLRRLPNPDGSPADADLNRKRKVLTLRTEAGGKVELWTAPSRRGGACFWWNRSSGCYSQAAGELAYGISGGGATVFLSGPADEDVTTLELRYEDGAVERIRPTEGYVLHEIPSAHYPVGKRLRLLVALDAHGAELARRELDPTAMGVYPCKEPLRIGRQSICP